MQASSRSDLAEVVSNRDSDGHRPVKSDISDWLPTVVANVKCFGGTNERSWKLNRSRDVSTTFAVELSCFAVDNRHRVPSRSKSCSFQQDAAPRFDPDEHTPTHSPHFPICTSQPIYSLLGLKKEIALISSHQVNNKLMNEDLRARITQFSQYVACLFATCLNLL